MFSMSESDATSRFADSRRSGLTANTGPVRSGSPSATIRYTPARAVSAAVTNGRSPGVRAFASSSFTRRGLDSPGRNGCTTS